MSQQAIVYFICALSFLHHLKQNKPFHYLALEKWVMKECKNIPLSLLFGLMTPQQAVFTVLTKLNPTTLSRAAELASWAKTVYRN
jgi:hypothetical protein